MSKPLKFRNQGYGAAKLGIVIPQKRKATEAPPKEGDASC